MSEIFDPVNVSALKALKSVLGDDFSELIHDFNIHSSDCLLKLERAIHQTDRAAIQSLAHSLKGSALSLHAKPLAASCGELESLAKIATADELSQRVQQIHDDVKDVITAIEACAYE